MPATSTPIFYHHLISLASGFFITWNEINERVKIQGRDPLCSSFLMSLQTTYRASLEFPYLFINWTQVAPRTLPEGEALNIGNSQKHGTEESKWTCINSLQINPSSQKSRHYVFHSHLKNKKEHLRALICSRSESMLRTGTQTCLNPQATLSTRFHQWETDHTRQCLGGIAEEL